MCGIVGSFAYSSTLDINPRVLEAMRDSMAHRGPDGKGLWLSRDAKVGLGHRRLSIVDLSASASQPLANEDESVWVTFNGEIYNHVELRQRLLAAGHRFRTDHSDTEVIVHGYEEWGIDGLVKAMDGDFAIGLWDDKKDELYLIRDRVGVKPLYYADQGGTLHFASEIKAILKHPNIPRALHAGAMRHYLAFLTTPPPWTMFDGIYKLLAGHYLRVSRRDGISVNKYWDSLAGQSEFQFDSADPMSYATEVRRRLAAAVAKRNMSDVPIGVFLSGGIDSTTNLSLMSSTLDSPVNTFTVGFRDYPEMNETREAREAAEAFGADHHEVLIERSDMEGYIENLVHSQDEPIADWVCIPLHFVSKLVRDSGVRVVQVGEGSDEQFVGYGHYRKYYQIQRHFWGHYLQAPRLLRSIIASAVGAIADKVPRLERHADFLERAAVDGDLFWSGALVFWDRSKNKLLKKGLNKDRERMFSPHFYNGADVARTSDFIREMYRPLGGAPEDEFIYQRMIYSEFKIRLPELLLMRVDKITMASSIEARVPFLDHRLVELTMEMPDSIRFGKRGFKSVLKDAIQSDIPAVTMNRKKRGFDAPMSQWLRADFGHIAERQIMNSVLVKDGVMNADFIEQLFRDHRAGQERAMLIWVIYNLIQWHKYWIE